MTNSTLVRAKLSVVLQVLSDKSFWTAIPTLHK